MSDPTESAETPMRRRYIIVVHGIGEQKFNETATPIVHRFAEVRQAQAVGHLGNLLPSYLSAQSVHHAGRGHGWSEFNGIAAERRNLIAAGRFDGTAATSQAGLNFRFVDLHWAHLLRRHQGLYSSPTNAWATALQSRLRFAPKGWLPDWADPLLDKLINVALPLEKLLALRYADLAKRIFRDFLGDVHLYGDYYRTRGRAVRHFHAILDEVHLRDFIAWYRQEKAGRRDWSSYRPPEYTIIAHSLGSILSFDALVYSRALDSIRSASDPAAHSSPSLPFAGYTDGDPAEPANWRSLLDELTAISEEIGDAVFPHFPPGFLKSYFKDDQYAPHRVPPLLWRDHVRNFVTLGSPVDKYHVLWFQNYYHMGPRMRDPRDRDQWIDAPGASKDWAGGWLDEQATSRIAHYNLCDEQDPVGHYLDVARATDHYEHVFQSPVPIEHRDVVFRRYAVPGVAHVKYWDDTELFRGIVEEVIDGSEESRGFFYRKSFWEKDRSIYRTAMTWAYFRIPFTAAVITFLLLAYGLSGLLPCLQDPASASRCEVGLAHVLALLAAVLLWACPQPTRAYVIEAEPGRKRGACASLWNQWRPRRSILALLVAGAIEWRRVLLRLTKRQSAKSKAKPGPGKGDFARGGFWRYGWTRYVAAVLLAAIPCAYLEWRIPDSAPQVALALLLLFGVTYASVMLYVVWLFYRAKAEASPGSFAKRE